MEQSEIKVTVVKFGDRPTLQLQWRDPNTGKKKTKSAETSNEREAERKAGEHEKKLRAGTYRGACRTTWTDFWERYEDEYLSRLAPGTLKKSLTVRSMLVKILAPERITDLTTARLSYFQSQMRKRGRTEQTITGYLAHLRAALQWGVDMESSCPCRRSLRQARRTDSDRRDGRSPGKNSTGC